MLGKSDYFNFTGITLGSEYKVKELRTQKNNIFQ